MRLIDADAVISVAEGEFSEEDVSKIRWLISHIGTAYDIDKVVEKLEEIDNNYVRYNPPMNDYECGFEEGVECMAGRAIEIVKEGVKNE